MTILDAIVLGLVQGLTEFIPVSSSGHLVLAQHVLGVQDFTFSVLLNFGTLLALVVFYGRRLYIIARGIITERKLGLALKLAAATVPAVVLGFFLEDFFEALNRNIGVVIAMLALLGAVMVFFGSERKGEMTGTTGAVGWRPALLIGLAQAIALVPGTSRSGITILTGLSQRLSATTAAEFSFMLAIPTILGASLKVLLGDEGRAFAADHLGLLLVGNLVSFISGYAAVSFLIGLLGRRGLAPFGWYRLGLAALLAILLLTGVL